MKKKLLPFLATGVIAVASIFPFGADAEAASYYPTYTCYYRDVSGSCINYQTSSPTYPFNTFYNTQSVTPSTWDNRYSNTYNSRYKPFYHGGIEATDYIDYYDSEYYNDGQWKYYYDQKENTVRPYRFQATNYYNDGYRSGYNRGNTHYEYESIHITCTGRDCASYK